MADEELLAEAGELLKRAATVTRDGTETLTDEDVDRGISLLRALAEKPEGADVRRDLKAVEGQLESFRGQPMQDAVGRLMSDKPQARTPATKKAATKQGATKKAAAAKPADRKSRGAEAPQVRVTILICVYDVNGP